MKILDFVFRVIAIIITVTVFEYLKALISSLQGDKKPSAQKRLTLNPIAHFEPVGFIIFVFTGYGWGKPVPTSSVNYKDKKRGTVLTYGLPIVICIVLGIVLKIICLFTADATIIQSFLYDMARCMVSIGIFNIIPVYPLSGSWILKCFLKPNSAIKFAQNEKLIQVLVVFLLLLGLLGKILDLFVNILI